MRHSLGHDDPIESSRQFGAVTIFELKFAEAGICGHPDFFPVNHVRRGFDDVNETWRSGEMDSCLVIRVAQNPADLTVWLVGGATVRENVNDLLPCLNEFVGRSWIGGCDLRLRLILKG